MQASIKKIILATDLSDTSKNASDYALLLANNCEAELKVLHVFDISIWNIPPHFHLTPTGPGGGSWFVEGLKEAKQQAKDSLTKFAKSLALEIETIFTEGDPSHEIIRVAEENDTDLIIMGTHGYSGWKRFTIGSVAELVTRHAPCAVLTIRTKKK